MAEIAIPLLSSPDWSWLPCNAESRKMVAKNARTFRSLNKIDNFLIQISVVHTMS